MNMAFSLTTLQIRCRTKTVTRRLGHKKLKAGTRFRAVVKGMGLRKEEKVEHLCDLEVVSVRSERIDSLLDPASPITGREEVVKEGFPEWTPAQFVAFFCKSHKCREDQVVQRIEFKYLES